MRQAQFFLFGLIVMWFTASGKLRALWLALTTEPTTAPSTPVVSTPAPAEPGFGGSGSNNQVVPGI